MLAQGLHRLGVAPEQPTWHRVNEKWVWGTSAQILQAEKAAEEAIAALRERISELQAEVRERNLERMREAMHGNGLPDTWRMAPNYSTIPHPMWPRPNRGKS